VLNRLRFDLNANENSVNQSLGINWAVFSVFVFLSFPHIGEEWLILISGFLHNHFYGAGFIFRIFQYEQGRLVAPSYPRS
jgi:hypothetical protein